MLVVALVALVGIAVSSPARASLPAAGELVAPLEADPFTQLVEASERAAARSAELALEASRFGVFAPAPCGAGLFGGECAEALALGGLKTRVWGFGLSGEAYLQAGQRFRWETRWLFQNRYYDPELARFTSTDPLGYVDGPSMYAFAGNDPVNNSDPYGLCSLTDLGDCAKQAWSWLTQPFRDAEETKESLEDLDDTMKEATYGRSKAMDRLDDPNLRVQPDLHQEGREEVGRVREQSKKVAANAGKTALHTVDRVGAAKAVIKVAAASTLVLAAVLSKKGTLEVFENQLPKRLAAEMADAAKVGAKPIEAGKAVFDEALNAGRIKWVITEDGRLVITPHTVNNVEISHAILSGGKPAIAAGQADVAASAGQYVGIGISEHSGHFMPSKESLELGRRVFEALGVTFPREP